VVGDVVGVEVVVVDVLFARAAYPPTAIIMIIITTIAMPAVLLMAFFTLDRRVESIKADILSES
jgi:uncharacterized membrane protein